MNTPLKSFVILAGLFAFGIKGIQVCTAEPPPPTANPELVSLCLDKLAQNAIGTESNESLKAACKNVRQLEACRSSQGRPIFSLDRPGSDPKAKRILILSLIHGDETASLELARFWMARIFRFDPKNSWRFVPILNPDGVAKHSRTNGTGTDLNRNFPTANWENEAIGYWTKHARKDPRRNPGTAPGSEPETRCVIQHYDEFKPDLVVSIHTPFGILDFDGPEHRPHGRLPLPWKHLGTYPGSLGRYLWGERQVPVLTVELTGNITSQHWAQWASLQDTLSFLAK